MKVVVSVWSVIVVHTCEHPPTVSVFDKVRECRFFLARMADYESAEDIENFLFCLSAFLSAFRSIAYKLYGVTEKQRGKTAKITLKKELHTHPQVGFLIGRSNVEVQRMA